MAPGTSDRRARIVDSAMHLLETAGVAAVTTRAVAAGAGVQSPVIYRLFGDMDGLIAAVVVAGFNDYLARKPEPKPGQDPVDSLRAGWDAHVEFGLAHPELYRLMYAPSTVGQISDAAQLAYDRLLGITRRIARAGRLTVDTFRAADMMHSGAMGVTFTMLNTPPEQRDGTLPERMRELIIGSITENAVVSETMTSANLASALNEYIAETDAPLSSGERALLGELLTRLARDTGSNERRD
jgi:AcrR family transcriptional regulator